MLKFLNCFKVLYSHEKTACLLPSFLSGPSSCAQMHNYEHGYVFALSLVMPFAQLALMSFQVQVGILTIPGSLKRSMKLSPSESVTLLIRSGFVASATLYLWLPFQILSWPFFALEPKSVKPPDYPKYVTLTCLSCRKW